MIRGRTSVARVALRLAPARVVPRAACCTAWGACWETSAGAGRLHIRESTSATLSGGFDVDLRTDTGNVSGGGPLTHVSARFNARCTLAGGC